jgi:hypothetical protein
VSVAHLRPLQAPNQKVHGAITAPAFAFTADGLDPGPAATLGGLSGGSSGVGDGGATGSGGAFRVPDTAMDFDKAWRRTCKTPMDRYAYLGLISLDKCASIFKAGPCLSSSISFSRHLSILSITRGNSSGFKNKWLWLTVPAEYSTACKALYGCGRRANSEVELNIKYCW